MKCLLGYEDDDLPDHTSYEDHPTYAGSDDGLVRDLSLARMGHAEDKRRQTTLSAAVPSIEEVTADVNDAGIEVAISQSTVHTPGCDTTYPPYEVTTAPTPTLPSNPVHGLGQSSPLVGPSNYNSPVNSRKRPREEEDDMPIVAIAKSVAFHPDTIDNGIWATGKRLKAARRDPTPGPCSENDLYGESAVLNEGEAALLTTAAPTHTPPPFPHKVRSVILDAGIDEQSDTAAQMRSTSPPALADYPVRLSVPHSAVERVAHPHYTPRIEPWAEPRADAECYGPPRAIVVTSPSGHQQVWRFPQELLRRITTFLGKQVSRLTSTPAPQPEPLQTATTGEITGAIDARKRKYDPDGDYPHLDRGRPQKRVRAIHVRV